MADERPTVSAEMPSHGSGGRFGYHNGPPDKVNEELMTRIEDSAALFQTGDLLATVREAIAAQDRLADDPNVHVDMAKAAIRAVAAWLDDRSAITASEELLDALREAGDG